MDTIRIAVCNQSAQDLMQLLSLIRGHERNGNFDLCIFPDLGGLFSRGRHFDVIFLAVGEGTPNGYDIACQMKAMGDKSSIILVADDYLYAVAGYRVALRYLPKPLTRAAVTEALDAAICKPAPERFAVESGNERNIYHIGDVYYVESHGHKITLHTMNGADRYYGTLRNMMSQLPQRYFVMIHKSLVVNLLYVHKVDTNNVTLIDGTELPIGPSRREEFWEKLNRFFGEECLCAATGQKEGN